MDLSGVFYVADSDVLQDTFLCVWLFNIKQHIKVDKTFAVGRMMMLMILTTCCLSVATALVDTKERIKQQHQVLLTVVQQVHGEFHANQNKQRAKDGNRNHKSRRHMALHDHKSEGMTMCPTRLSWSRTNIPAKQQRVAGL